jgi:hypothetical protein
MFFVLSHLQTIDIIFIKNWPQDTMHCISTIFLIIKQSNIENERKIK